MSESDDPNQHRSSISPEVGLGVVVLAAAILGGLVIGLNLLIAIVLGVSVVALSVGLLTLRRGRLGRNARTSFAGSIPYFVFGGIAVLLLAQLVPYGREHANPAGTGEPAWNSPRTRELMVNACYGCHSNEVDWPWYANIAPISWAVTDHVNEGRSEVNFSEFATDRGDADDSIETILDGSMPPRYYTAFGLHPEANLSDTEIAELVAGLRATPGLNDDEDERDEDERDEDERDEDDEDDREEEDREEDGD